MTKPLKVLKKATTCNSWSQKAIFTWVSTTCSMFSVFWAWSSLSHHHLRAVERILSIKSCLQLIYVVTRTNKPTHKPLHSYVMHSSSTVCWDSFAKPDFADCLSNESKQHGDIILIAASSCNQVGDSGQSCTFITGWSLERWISSADFSSPLCQRYFSLLDSLQGTLSGEYWGLLLEYGSANDWRCLSNLLRPSLLSGVNME